MKTYFAVTGVVKYKNRILILKKAPDDYNFPNCWSFCSGYIKEFESAEDTLLREIKEETGLKAKIMKKGRIFLQKYPAKGKEFYVMPFLCKVNSGKINLDHENTEYRWVAYEDIVKYSTVPGLRKDLKVLGLL
ncbi:NUDIX hydrolase [Candidatus Woesearchaeota archaeon]|nr:NUDIX hydrolase [Candidatus Woesearchaeota archaeon]